MTAQTGLDARLGVTRLDTATHDHWMAAMARHQAHGPSNSDGIMDLLRRSRGYQTFDIDNLTHLLQTATRAERAGASDEIVLAALLHDVTAPFALFNHAEAAAHVLAPHVAPDVTAIVRTHQDFQGRYYFQHFGGDVDRHLVHAGARWFDLAVQFSDEWDQCSFDPDYPSHPLDHFEPLVRQYCDVQWGAARGTGL
jgi:predicted HD phosphohydrolase